MLLLHDYVTVVELIWLTLNHGPYATEVAATPVQAVSILEGWKPHVIILDMDLDAQPVIERIGSKPGAGYAYRSSASRVEAISSASWQHSTQA